MGVLGTVQSKFNQGPFTPRTAATTAEAYRITHRIASHRGSAQLNGLQRSIDPDPAWPTITIVLIVGYDTTRRFLLVAPITI